jgi:hypothetical protein
MTLQLLHSEFTYICKNAFDIQYIHLNVNETLFQRLFIIQLHIEKSF